MTLCMKIFWYVTFDFSHGTKVTGLIAAVKDNNICIPGVAYNSTIVGESHKKLYTLTNVP